MSRAIWFESFGTKNARKLMTNQMVENRMGFPLNKYRNTKSDYTKLLHESAQIRIQTAMFLFVPFVQFTNCSSKITQYV